MHDALSARSRAADGACVSAVSRRSNHENQSRNRRKVIATLQGTVTARGENFIIVETGGIGLRVYVPTALMARWGKQGRQAQLFTYLHLRENEMSLYGFETEEELSFFEVLLGVSGIGPKLALGVLSVATADSLRLAIAKGDIEYLVQMPGIGKKTAQRIVLDLKGKLEMEDLIPAAPLTPVDQEVIVALTSLGYTLSEAREVVASLPEEEMSLEERLMLAVRYFGGE
jgi:Holliday junction DNA helicase RuvA